MLTAFDYLSVLYSHRVLGSPMKKTTDYILQTDASQLGMGGVSGERQHRKTRGLLLQEVTPDYTITELECLAIVRSVEHFGIHLLGTKLFTLVVDPKLLKALKTSSKLTGRVL